MATRPKARPLSPHLGIWKWGPHMLVSILHRATGVGMALVGLPLLTWWLAAIATGGEAYATFVDVFTVSGGGLNIIGYLVGIGLTLALFQHMMTGLRHFVLDTGAGYELKINRMFAMLTMVASVVLTAAFWAYIVGVR
ncbi:succinate dehydrogenase [Sphingomonas sp. Leaf17]|uniref:succinate dehydrogenase, cytochrome b556 subunit n=1 Tax=Sphingomonas sp. Leaf17 TaxID=1735683 RepID=UPI0006F5268E|nr:succinate dehydrogenase, cytochrome b556 subunit [Sphingomonas sp. Leaf17]KQM63348.1 succinate dehydrogenase [Sphingomonas sp. Leaf17]